MSAQVRVCVAERVSVCVCVHVWLHVCTSAHMCVPVGVYAQRNEEGVRQEEHKGEERVGITLTGEATASTTNLESEVEPHFTHNDIHESVKLCIVEAERRRVAVVVVVLVE